jgi:hypothetical protein
MISPNQHEKEKNFIETYIYGKDEHGKHISGGYSVHRFVDSAITSHIGLQRLQDLSVPLGLVHVPAVMKHSSMVGGALLPCQEVKIMENEIADKLLHSVCHSKFTHLFENQEKKVAPKRTSRKMRRN